MLSPPWPMKGCSTPLARLEAISNAPRMEKKEPKNIVFIQCVGSRDRSIGRPYCSAFCCMYTAKQAVLTKDHLPDSSIPYFLHGYQGGGRYTTSSPGAPWKNMEQIISVAGFPLSHPDGNGQYVVMGADTPCLASQSKSRLTLLYCPWVVEASAGAPGSGGKIAHIL